MSKTATPRRPGHRRMIGRLALVLALAGGDAATAGEDTAPLPSFAELEAAGTRIGDVRIVTHDVFDTEDLAQDRTLYRWANALHVKTRPAVIEQALLFRRGDLLSVQVIQETERLLLSNRYLREVDIVPVACHDGVVDIEVVTRDTWSLDPGVSLGRSGGVNTGGIHLKDYNLFGTGIAASLGHSKGIDRSSNELSLLSERTLGTWTNLAYSHASNSDGTKDTASVMRPFYALDSRWAAGASLSKDNRVDSIYNAGVLTSQYRHRQDRAEVFGGWSPGLRNGWVQRYSAGVSYSDDTYTPDAGLVAPSRLPQDETLVGPFVRVELIEDRYERELNRNLIGRPEFFALGLSTSLQVGFAPAKLGSTENTVLYDGRISRGFEPYGAHRLITSGQVTGQFSGGKIRRQRAGAQAQYYLPQDNKRWLFYASAAGDVLTRPDVNDELLLGGDNGLRGYPLRYQSGDRRALFTLEERFFTDWYLYRMFRVGGAAFFDSGRAWGGHNTNTVNPGWLNDVGLGLRFVSTRSAFSNVLHVDLAVPLNATSDIKKVQFLIKTKTSF